MNIMIGLLTAQMHARDVAMMCTAQPQPTEVSMLETYYEFEHYYTKPLA